MKIGLHTYFRARKTAHKFARRGDFDAAAKWLRIAERELRLSDRFEETVRTVEAREFRERYEDRKGETPDYKYWDDVISKLAAELGRRKRR